MDPVAVSVANALQGVLKDGGVRSAVETAMQALLSISDRQELHTAVCQWGEANTVLGLALSEMPPEVCSGNGSINSSQGRRPTDSPDAPHPPASQPPAHSLPQLQLPVAAPSLPPPSVGGRVMSNTHGTHHAPPWLALVGLPNDSTHSTEDEVFAFADFVATLQTEQSARAYMRTSLQKLVQLLVSSEATLKVIGGWGTGLATFSSQLDLVLESPSRNSQGEDTCLLSALYSVLRGFGLECELCVVNNYKAVRLDAHSMVENQRGHAAASKSLSSGSSGSGDLYDVLKFNVNIFSDRVAAGGGGASVLLGPPQSRQASLQTSMLLSRFPSGYRKLAVTLRHMLLRTNAGSSVGGIGGYCVLLLIIAYLQHTSTDPRFGDLGWVFREFFTFFSSFDFAHTAVRIASADATGVGNFFPRTACPFNNPEQQLLIVDPLNGQHNIAEMVTKLPQITATLSYMHQIIKRYDADSRGTSLLPNLIGCSEEMKRRYRYMVQEGRAPAAPASSTPASSVAASSNPGTPRGRQPYAPVPRGPHTRVHDDAAAGAAAASAAAAAGPPAPRHVVVNAARIISEFIDEGKNHAVKDELLYTLASKTDDVLAHIILSQGSSGELWEYRGRAIRVLLAGLSESADDPTVAFHLKRESRMACVGLGDIVGPQVAEKVAVEAADYLEYLKAHKPEQHDALVKELIGDGSWSGNHFQEFSTYMKVFTSLRENHPNSVFASVPDSSIPALAKILHEYSDLPEVRKNRQRAAAACMTKDFVLAVSQDILAFLGSDLPARCGGGGGGGALPPDLPPEKHPKALRSRLAAAHASGDVAAQDDAHVDMLLAVSELPGSRIMDFRGDACMLRTLKGMMKPFESDPDVQRIHTQMAATVIGSMMLGGLGGIAGGVGSMMSNLISSAGGGGGANGAEASS